MRVGSLFSGIGGIEFGLERAGGFETAWFVECDPHTQAVLRKHWPSTPIHADVATVDFASLPRIDVLTGGFPCQDISNAGKRAGITGHRSGLWKHYLRAIVSLRPRFVFAENVAALTQRGLDTVLCDLAAIGYDAEWHCVPASAVGAHHRRDRIIILAYPNDGGCLHRQLGEQSDNGREYALSHVKEGSQDVADTEQQPWTPQIKGGGERGCERPEMGYEHRASREDVPDACWSGLEGESEARPPAGYGWWAVEPTLGRVAHGVPHRVDRIKCLGNAVVPQWAQAVGEAINEEMRR